MAWTRRGRAIGHLAVSCGLGVACSAGEGRTTDASTSTSGEDGTTNVITTFQPTTSIDPSDPTLTGTSAESGDETGTTTGSTSLDGGSSSSDEGSTSSGGDEAPTVQSTSPTDLMSGVPADTTIEVSFSEAMDPATITTNVDGNCTGSIQVSADGFATCVAMTGLPATGDDQTYLLTPAAALASATAYQIRVLATATDAGGTPMDADFTTPDGFIVRYFHTITLDGIDDFDAGETRPTSTMGYTARVAWDSTYLYLGMDGAAVGGGSPQDWLVVYLGGPAGTNQGVTYQMQSPALPFDARWHLQWRPSDGFWNALEWTGAAWEGAGFVTPPQFAASGTFVELRLPWSEIGDPAYLDLHVGMLNELPGSEWSWAAMPEGSYMDSYDPDYGQYLQIDRSGSTLPADLLPM